jgi:hypothetical protein
LSTFVVDLFEVIGGEITEMVGFFGIASGFEELTVLVFERARKEGISEGAEGTALDLFSRKWSISSSSSSDFFA